MEFIKTQGNCICIPHLLKLDMQGFHLWYLLNSEMQNVVNAVTGCQQFENQIVCFNVQNTNGQRKKALLTWASSFFEKCRAQWELTGQAIVVAQVEAVSG